MLTQCPQCQTIYQITASELAAANAFVECGECGSQFNALDRIADDPDFERHEESADIDPKLTEAEPAGEEIEERPTITLLEETSHEEPAVIADEDHEEVGPQGDIEPSPQEAAMEPHPSPYPAADLPEPDANEEALDTTLELDVAQEAAALLERLYRKSPND